MPLIPNKRREKLAGVKSDYRASRAHDALRQIEIAWGLADPEDKAALDLLRGSLTALIPNAEEESCKHFESQAGGLRCRAERGSTKESTGYENPGFTKWKRMNTSFLP